MKCPPSKTRNNYQVLISCYTSSAQRFKASTGRFNVDPLNQNSAVFTYDNDVRNSPTPPLNIDSVFDLWLALQKGLLNAIAPATTKSAFHLILQQFALSSLEISYEGRLGLKDLLISEIDSHGQPNSPANDHWEMKLSSTGLTALTENVTYLNFFANGSVDTTRTSPTDLANIESLFFPAITKLASQTTQIYDFWTLINWIYVSYYWTVLFDLGQVVPTINNTPFPSTNNIFINQTLFDIYSSYLRGTIYPLLNAISPFDPIPGFQSLSNGNNLRPETRHFFRGYACTERRLKAPMSLIIAVIVADYALIMSAYKVTILVARFLETRHRQDGPFSTKTQLIVGNYCEGCMGVVKSESPLPTDEVSEKA